jgi:hypothetical protein
LRARLIPAIGVHQSPRKIVRRLPDHLFLRGGPAIGRRSRCRLVTLVRHAHAARGPAFAVERVVGVALLVHCVGIGAPCRRTPARSILHGIVLSNVARYAAS